MGATEALQDLDLEQIKAELARLEDPKQQSSEKITALIQVLKPVLDKYQDLELLFNTTLAHNTQLENELSYKADAATETSHKYEFIVNSSDECMVLINSDLNLEALNDAFCAFFGSTRDQLLNKQVHSIWGGSVYEKYIYAPLDQVFKEKKQALKEIRVEKDGEVRILDLHFFPYFGGHGDQEVSHVVLTFRDVSEKKHLENQLNRAQRMESVGTLASGIAHDMNNILTPFSLGLKMLEKKIDDEDGQRIIQLLHSSMKRGSDLVRQILDFSRGTEGEKTPLQLRYLIQELTGLMGATFPKNITIHVDIPDQLSVIMGDASQLHQLFLNLMVNARDALPDGGNISVIAQNMELKAPMQIMGVTLEPGDYVKLVVEDDGIGIDEKDKEKIFEPFYTTKSMMQGTGIGLSTGLNIIRSHQGAMDIESEVDKGSHFTLYFPALTSEVLPKAVTGEKKAVDLKSLRLLLVDDEEKILEVTSEYLKESGLKVDTANSGRAALDCLENSKYDLMILDMMMPEMSGMEVLDILHETHPELKVIGVTGAILSQYDRDQCEIKVDCLLYKPYSSEALFQAIQEISAR